MLGARPQLETELLRLLLAVADDQGIDILVADLNVVEELIREELGHLERIRRDEPRDGLLGHLLGGARLLDEREAAADLGRQLLEARVGLRPLAPLRDAPRELVVGGRQPLLADLADRQLVTGRARRTFGIRLVLHLARRLALVAGPRAEHGARELGERRVLPRVHRKTLHGLADRSARVIERDQIDDDEIARDRLAVHDGEVGVPLAQRVEVLLDGGVLDGRNREPELEPAVAGGRDVRPDLDARLERQRRVLSVLELLEVRIGQREKAVLLERFLKGARHHALDDLALDRLAVARPDHVPRRLPLTEAREGDARVQLPIDGLEVAGDILGRHLDGEHALPLLRFFDGDLHGTPILVREGGVEPPRVASLDPKSSASASSATLARLAPTPSASPTKRKAPLPDWNEASKLRVSKVQPCET